MRYIFLCSLLMISVSANAAEFRCFAKYLEGDRSADLLGYGEIVNGKAKNVRLEFVGDNGFYSETEITKVKSTNYVERERLKATGLSHEVLYTLDTNYNPLIGDYRGDLEVTRDGESVSFPIRCVILRGI